MTQTRPADDFATIRARMEELRHERERGGRLPRRRGRQSRPVPVRGNRIGRSRLPSVN